MAASTYSSPRACACTFIDHLSTVDIVQLMESGHPPHGAPTRYAHIQHAKNQQYPAEAAQGLRGQQATLIAVDDDDILIIVHAPVWRGTALLRRLSLTRALWQDGHGRPACAQRPRLARPRRSGSRRAGSGTGAERLAARTPSVRRGGWLRLLGLAFARCRCRLRAPGERVPGASEC